MTSVARFTWVIPWVLLLVAALVLAGADDYVLTTAIVAALSGIVAIGLNMLMGYAGLLNLSVGVFYALGAYGAAKMTVADTMPPVLMLIVMPLAALVVGALIGIPILRTRGLHFAVATLGLGLIITDVLENWLPVTNGPLGIVGITRPESFGPIDPTTNSGFFVMTVVILALVMVAASLYHRSKVARVLIAVRDDELLTRSLGFEVPAYKVTAFAFSAALASLAGVLYAWFIQFIAPAPFTFFAISFPVFVMVAVGGPGSLWGPLVGAAFLTALPELLHVEAQTKQILYGIILLLVVIFLRRGIAPTCTYYSRLLLARLSGRRRGAVEAALPPAARAGEGLSGASSSELERV